MRNRKLIPIDEKIIGRDLIISRFATHGLENITESQLRRICKNNRINENGKTHAEMIGMLRNIDTLRKENEDKILHKGRLLRKLEKLSDPLQIECKKIKISRKIEYKENIHIPEIERLHRHIPIRHDGFISAKAAERENKLENLSRSELESVCREFGKKSDYRTNEEIISDLRAMNMADIKIQPILRRCSRLKKN